MITEFLTVEQIANQLGIHANTVKTHIKKGRLKAYQIGQGYKCKPEDVEAFIEQQIVQPQQMAEVK